MSHDSMSCASHRRFFLKDRVSSPWSRQVDSMVPTAFSVQRYVNERDCGVANAGVLDTCFFLSVVDIKNIIKKFWTPRKSGRVAVLGICNAWIINKRLWKRQPTRANSKLATISTFDIDNSVARDGNYQSGTLSHAAPQ